MPPRHAYWTIIVDDQPTSFRAHDVEELLPTFNRLREKHPNAQLKWFERGQLFDTRDAAREQGFGKGERRWEGPRPDRAGDSDGETAGFSRRNEPGASRGRDWRPGGEHRDPRQKYKDAKKAKWDRYKQNLRSRWEEKQERHRADDDLPPPVPDRGDHTPPHGDPIRPKLAPRRNLGAPAAYAKAPADRSGPPRDRESWRDRPRDDRRRDDRRRDDRGRDDWRRDPSRAQSRDSRPQSRDDRPRDFRRDDDRRGEWKPKGPPRDRDRKPWGGKPGGKFGGKPGGSRKPWGSKPSSSGARGESRGGFRKKPFGASGGQSRRAGPARPPRGPKKRRDDDE